VVFDWQVNGEEAGGDCDCLTQGLDGQVFEFDADRVFNLCEILASNRNPFFPVLDQKITTSGKAGKIFTETGGKPIIAG
jgi:hypothetical protein